MAKRVKWLSGHWDSLFTTSKSIKLSSLLFGRELISLRTSSEGFSDLGPVVALTPLTSATTNSWWNPEMVVPRSEMLTLLQDTLCMIGNVTVDRSWSKFGSDDFPSAKDTQFGEDFQSSLMRKG